jgi:hypothetical protein
MGINQNSSIKQANNEFNLYSSNNSMGMNFNKDHHNKKLT